MDRPPPINVRFAIKNCHNCKSCYIEDGNSYCSKADAGQPWNSVTGGEAISLEDITCDSWEPKE